MWSIRWFSLCNRKYIKRCAIWFNLFTCLVANRYVRCKVDCTTSTRARYSVRLFRSYCRRFSISCSIRKKTFPANENNLPLIYPNPNQGIFSIRIDGFAEEATEVIVMSLTGIQISKTILYDSNILIDLGEIPKGWYYVLIRRGEATFRRKVVVE